MKYNILIFSITFLLLVHGIQAQVTIGSNATPRTGSLLDLKENGMAGDKANANKGLGLPRVALSSPTTLTIDDKNEMDYVGQTVYNITNNLEMTEGIYIWDGTKWDLTVSNDDYGKNGQLLISKGNGSFDWSASSFPEYDFQIPTQVSVFEDGIIKSFKYSYSQVNDNPSPSVFNNHFVYEIGLNVQTERDKSKYLIIGIAANVYELTRNGGMKPTTAFWQVVKIDVLIGDQLIKSYRRICSTPALSNTNVDIDTYSIIPLTGKIGKGMDILKIRVSNVQNTFSENTGSGGGGGGSDDGRFNTRSNDFYFVSLKDVSFALYENENE